MEIQVEDSKVNKELARMVENIKTANSHVDVLSIKLEPFLTSEVQQGMSGYPGSLEDNKILNSLRQSNNEIYNLIFKLTVLLRRLDI
jgi:hypothetical protein